MIKIPLISDFPTQLRRVFDVAREQALRDAEELSPRPGAEHPYATGTFARSWRWDTPTNLQNTTPYAHYADGGYTRYGGPESARSYARPPYSQRIVERFALRFRLELRGFRRG